MASLAGEDARFSLAEGGKQSRTEPTERLPRENARNAGALDFSRAKEMRFSVEDDERYRGLEKRAKAGDPSARNEAQTLIPLSERFQADRDASDRDGKGEGKISFSLAEGRTLPGGAPADAEYADLLEMIERYRPLADRAAGAGFAFGKAEGKTQLKDRLGRARDKMRASLDTRMAKLRQEASERQEKAVLAARIGERAKGRRQGWTAGFYKSSSGKCPKQSDISLWQAITGEARTGVEPVYQVLQTRA